ncbi:hypothetical protein [Novosphingobium sp. P6W]|uniref:hypothetical protein n=1 Tax=Novosphingobium sp. P6W TaxID=1609758 RepID=UPI0005C307A0|nr:hypothetical protein [Novosphingobium sp. P6W]AXB75674.1 hypothetical protein TQ38_003380 [Novosphingobium sp. P6W]KIS33101.1 hypothetical protein TQ38_06500 [Novosphingobium sp. P6W]
METSLKGLERSALTDARQMRSRNALTDALLTLLEEKSFEQLTIREITARAGRNWLPQDLGIIHGTSSTFDILAWWLAQVGDSAGPRLSPEQVANILHRLVIVPLAGDTAERGTARTS